MTGEVMVRTYQGRNQEDAALLYAQDAPAMAEEGWVPVTQTWATGDWPAGAYLVATLLIVVGIGVFILAAMVLFKPSRTLIVTYGRPGADGARDA